MIVSDISIVERPQGPALRGVLRPENRTDRPFELEYIVRGGSAEWLAPTGDPFLAAALTIAMIRRETLTIDAPVSPRLLQGASTLMDIYQAWFPRLARVDIVAPAAETAAPSKARGSALFFSGGADSFYSLLKHADPAAPAGPRGLTHLVLVFGFDVKLGNPVLFDKIAGRLADVADQADLRLVVVETNVRRFSDRIIGWNPYHSGALASVGLALSGLFRRVMIASSYAYQELHPHGSHPLLDPLWTTEGVELIHDGCEATRLQKIARLARSPLALGALRVCWENEDTQYNCGECEKCLRTMIALHIVGALDRTKVFARPLTAAAVRRAGISSDYRAIFLRELQGALGSSPADRQLSAAMTRAILARRVRTLVGNFLRENLGPWATMPGVRRARQRARPERA